MSRKGQGIHSKQSMLQKITDYASTGYTNNRLEVHSVHPQNPKLSFDTMTIVGDFNRDNARKLSSFMSIEPQIRPWDILQTKLKAKTLQEKVYIGYNRIKTDTWDRHSMRVEFNPNKLTREEMLWLKQNIIGYMEDDGFTGIGLASDLEDGLSSYYVATDEVVKRTVFYGHDGKSEAKYFGVCDSDRFIRTYNEEQKHKDNADVEVVSDHLWHVEIELKRNMVDCWNDYFNDLYILKPDQTSPEESNE